MANPQSVAVLKKALKFNLNAVSTRLNPNAAKLLDGAIQRASVQPHRNSIPFKTNSAGVGFTQRPHQGVQSSGSLNLTSDPWSNFVAKQNKVGRIYMPQKKHNQNHPADKTIGNYWVVDFETESTFKSPLMQWTSGTNDCFNARGDMMQIRFPDVNAAVEFCESMGYGYDVMYPHFLWHVKKNYQDNFAYKGLPKEEPQHGPDSEYD